MTNTVFLDTSLRVARAALTGTALPTVSARLLTRLKIIAKFFDSDGDQIEIDTGTAVCVIKPKSAPSGAPSLIDITAVLSGSTTTAAYTFEWESADSVALRAILDAVADPSQPTELRCEIQYELDGELERIAFPIYFDTAYNRPEDAAPDATADSSLAWLALHAKRYYPAITTLIGGTSTALDGIDTTDLAARTLVLLVINDGTYDLEQTWMLYASSDAEDTASGIVRPDDYNASTNIKAWKRIA